jgi:hypothetical protein
MHEDIREIQTEQDAERVSAVILRSLDDPSMTFNPLKARLMKYRDDGIRFMGKDLNREQAFAEVARHIWENRKRINKQIRKWQKVGPDLVDCGC